jgi:small subunit ribosomal protein S1
MDLTTGSVPEGALEPKTKITGKVVKTTLAGVIVDLGLPLPGVIHISQLQKDPVNRVEDVVQIGQQVEVWVRRSKKDRIELTMIEPLELEWREMKAEMVVKGKVVRLESYGAFVDIGAERPGLIHVSELAYGYIKNPSEIVHEGDEVEAMILDVNRRKKQIRLSMKAIQPKPEEAPAPRVERKSRGKRSRPSQEQYEGQEAAPSTPELTAMEIAWREALERAGTRQKGGKGKHKADSSGEHEEILNRTLEHRLPTG